MSKKNPILKGRRLVYNAAQQQRYILALRGLVRRMSKTVSREVIKLFETPSAKKYIGSTDASISSQARILTNSLFDRFEQLFSKEAKPIAEKMVKGALKTSATTLNVSLKKLSENVAIKTNTISSALKEVVKASVSENVDLIESIGSEYLSDVKQSVMRSITTGNGLKTLIPDLDKYYGQTDRRAKNVALDQTRKVYNAVNKGRMESVGIKKFEWIHSGGGQKPRESHMQMNGNIYSFDNLPIINKEQVAKGYEAEERGIPGQAINCKCTMTPVIEFENEGGSNDRSEE